MKKVTLLATIILALAMSASAQQLIDFKNMPHHSEPMPLPDGYAGLRWSSVYYVDALEYPDANGQVNLGAGFYTGPEAMVAFVGGPMCFKNYGAPVQDGITNKHICSADISVGDKALFQAVQANISAGWVAGFATIQAYNNGKQVGSNFYQVLSTNAQSVTFPNWGPITELVITPSPGGSLVLYTLTIQ